MNLLQRIGYYSVGLIMGIVILMFFLSGKKTSCDYSPTARVLKNIRIKDRQFSEEALQFFYSNNLDTSAVTKILNNGSVDFGRSETDMDETCKIYFISGEAESRDLELKIENCETTATIQKVEFLTD